jgi:hypothetical protein
MWGAGLCTTCSTPSLRWKHGNAWPYWIPDDSWDICTPPPGWMGFGVRIQVLPGLALKGQCYIILYHKLSYIYIYIIIYIYVFVYYIIIYNSLLFYIFLDAIDILWCNYCLSTWFMLLQSLAVIEMDLSISITFVDLPSIARWFRSDPHM